MKGKVNLMYHTAALSLLKWAMVATAIKDIIAAGDYLTVVPIASLARLTPRDCMKSVALSETEICSRRRIIAGKAGITY